MIMKDCEFEGGFDSQLGMIFNECIFFISKGDPIPPKCQCIDCLIVDETGKVELYGFVKN